VALKEKHINSLTPILTDLFESVRDIMNVREFGHIFQDIVGCQITIILSNNESLIMFQEQKQT